MKHLPLFDEPEDRSPEGRNTFADELERLQYLERRAPIKPDPDELWIADSEWKEVPQEIYLSWPPEQQAAYQAARDKNSAVYSNDDEWTDFFLRRARTWK